MINLVTLLILNAFVVYGFHAATDYKINNGRRDRDSSNILWWISYYGDQFLPYWLTKPLWNCPVCMSSIWGLWFWMFHPWEVGEIKHWVFYTLALAGICWLIGIIWEQKEMRNGRT